MAKARIEILGDSSSYQRSVREAAAVTDRLGLDMKKLSISAKSSAEAQVAASVRKDARLRGEIATYRAVAAASVKGSKEQIAATNLAAQAEGRLARSLGVSARESQTLNRSLGAAGHDVNRFGRGVLAGSGALGHFGRAAVFASSSVLGGYGLAFALRQLISSASTMQEETEKTGVVFGKNARQVQSWAGSLATSFGVGEGAALKAAGTFGNMLRPLNFGAAASAKMSERLVQLAADMASFNNARPDEVLAALQSGLTGQVRPLRQFGVFLSQARIQTEAYATGIAKQGAKLSTAQKVQASYNIILKDTKLAQGDVARNTGSLSVSQSKLTAALQDSEAIIGRALLPSLVDLANRSATYLDRLNKTGRLQRDVNEAVGDAKAIFGGLKDLLTPVVGAFRLLGKVTGGTGNEVKLLGTAFLLLEARARLVKWGLISAGIEGVGASAVVASGEVATLRTRLLGLSKLGPIAIAIGLSFIPPNKKGQAALDRAGLGFLGHLPIVGGAEQQVAEGGQRTHDFFFGKPGLKTQKQTPGLDPATRGFVQSTPHNVSGELKFTDPTRQSQLILHQTFTEAKLLNPKLTRKAFDLGQKVAQAFIDGIAKTPDSKKKTVQVGKGLSLQGQFNLAELRLANAQLTQTTADDRRILVLEEGIVKQQIAHTKKLKERISLTQQLGGILSQIRGIDQADAAATKAAAAAQRDRAKLAREHAQAVLQAREFRVLGLDPTGQPFTPKLRALRGELARVRDSLKGSSLDTRKNEGLLGNITKLLFGKDAHSLTKDVRATVKQILDGLRDEVKTAGPATKYQKANLSKLIAGFDLTAGEKKALKSRLSQVGAGGSLSTSSPSAAGGGFGGSATITVHHTTKLDGRVIEQSTTKHQQKRKRRNPPQKRGPHAGG